MPTIATETDDHLELELHLRVEAAPGHVAFRATIELPLMGLIAVAVERDLVHAVRASAHQCAERLGERGYPIAVAEILDALEVMDASKLPRALHSFDVGRS